MGTPVFVGIDISKKHLDLFLTPSDTSFSVPNTEAGLVKLVARLRQVAPQIILLEATGGYEFLAVAALREAGLPACFINPRQVRDFARSLGILAKTDRIDARVLAQFAEKLRPEPRPLPDAQQQELKHLMTRRRQLLEMIQMEQNRLQISHFPRVKQTGGLAGPERAAAATGPGYRRLLPALSRLAGSGPALAQCPRGGSPDLPEHNGLAP